MAGVYTVGDVARETAEFRVAGVLTNPTTITATVVAPDGTTSTPTPVQDSTGVYHVDVTVNQAGAWFVRIVGTGTAAGARETYFVARRSEVPGSNLTAEALVTVPDMLFFLDRLGVSDIDEVTWLEDLINSYSAAVHRFCNRQFTPERTPAAGRLPLLSDPLATGVTKKFAYDGRGYLSLAPYEARTVTSVVIGTDQPTAAQITLNAGSSTQESDYRLEPRHKTYEQTWLYLLISGQWFAGSTLGLGSEVSITGDWGAPAGNVHPDVAHACKIAVADAFRNPEGYVTRDVGGLEVTEPVQTTPGSLPLESRNLLIPHRRRGG